MNKVINRLLLLMLATAVLVAAGMLIAGILTGAPVYFVAGMSGLAAVGGSAAALHQQRRKQAAA